MNRRNVYLQISAVYGATNARLNHRSGNGKTGAWSTTYLEQGQWIQVDLGDITKVTKIGTQGRGQVYEWVTEYKVSMVVILNSTSYKIIKMALTW